MTVDPKDRNTTDHTGLKYSVNKEQQQKKTLDLKVTACVRSPLQHIISLILSENWASNICIACRKPDVDFSL